jgi:hypothetical protein
MMMLEPFSTPLLGHAATRNNYHSICLAARCGELSRVPVSFSSLLVRPVCTYREAPGSDWWRWAPRLFLKEVRPAHTRSSLTRAGWALLAAAVAYFVTDSFAKYGWSARPERPRAEAPTRPAGKLRN